jgi:hypothetical protein
LHSSPPPPRVVPALLLEIDDKEVSYNEITVMETARPYETSVSYRNTTWPHGPQHIGLTEIIIIANFWRHKVRENKCNYDNDRIPYIETLHHMYKHLIQRRQELTSLVSFITHNNTKYHYSGLLHVSVMNWLFKSCLYTPAKPDDGQYV